MKYTHGQKFIKNNERSGFGRTAAMIATATVLSLSVAGFSSAAREVGTGNPAGAGTVTATCSNVKSLSYKGDARVGELGFAQIDINYSVSPCDKTVPVRVELSLTQNVTGADAFYFDDNAALSNRVSVNGVKVNTSYIAKVRVFNASTGELIESSQIFASARTKPV